MLCCQAIIHGDRLHKSARFVNEVGRYIHYEVTWFLKRCKRPIIAQPKLLYPFVWSLVNTLYTKIFFSPLFPFIIIIIIIPFSVFLWWFSRLSSNGKFEIVVDELMSWYLNNIRQWHGPIKLYRYYGNINLYTWTGGIIGWLHIASLICLWQKNIWRALFPKRDNRHCKNEFAMSMPILLFMFWERALHINIYQYIYLYIWRALFDKHHLQT